MAAMRLHNSCGMTMVLSDDKPPYSMLTPSGRLGTTSVLIYCCIFFMLTVCGFQNFMSAATVMTFLPLRCTSCAGCQSGLMSAT